MGAGVTSPGCCDCGAGPVDDGSGTIPLCFCSGSIPSPLTLTSSDEACDLGQFRSCTLRWIATPAEYGGATSPLGARGFFSDESFADATSGATFRYYFHCASNLFVLRRVFATSPFGSPYFESVTYQWNAAANVCSPFAMTSGSPTSGSCPGNSVQVHA